MGTSQNHQVLRRSRIACIDILNITVEIRRQPRATGRRAGRSGLAAQRARLNREIAREQTRVHARWLLRG